MEGVEAFEVQEVEKDGMKVTKVKESFVLGLPTTEQKTEWMFGIKNIIKQFQQREFVAEKKRAESEAKLGATTAAHYITRYSVFTASLYSENESKKQRGLSREMSGMFFFKYQNVVDHWILTT